ncbi:hypothetical protein Hanom_Chr12g01137401 [Helianthus anomalus]
MTRSPLARRLSRYKKEGLRDRVFGLVRVIRPSGRGITFLNHCRPTQEGRGTHVP